MLLAATRMSSETKTKKSTSTTNHQTTTTANTSSTTGNSTEPRKKLFLPSRMYVGAAVLLSYCIFLLFCFSADGTEADHEEAFARGGFSGGVVHTLQQSAPVRNAAFSSGFSGTQVSYDTLPEQDMMVKMSDDIGMQDQTASRSSPGVPIPNLGNDMLRTLDDSFENLRRKEENLRRKLVHSGSMNFNVWNGTLHSSVKKIETLMLNLGDGAYIENTNFYPVWTYRHHYYASQTQDDKQDLKGVTMNLRIPHDQFKSFMETIQIEFITSPDMLLNIYTNSQDVTEEYIDATSRADVLEASRDAMKVLFRKATTISEVLQVQNEMNRLTERMESHRNRAMSLSKQSALSSLTLTMEEKVRIVTKPSKYDPSQYPIFSGSFAPISILQKAWANLAMGMANVGNVAVYLLVMLFFPMIVVLAIIFPASSSSGKHNGKWNHTAREAFHNSIRHEEANQTL